MFTQKRLVARRFIRLVIAATGFIVGGIEQGLAPAASQDADAAPYRLEVREGLVTLEIGDASLHDVLRALGEQAGFQISIRGELDDPVVKRSFSDIPVDQAVRRLAGDTSMVMVYSPAQSEAGSTRLVEVLLFENGATGLGRAAATPVIRSPATAMSGLSRIESDLTASKHTTRLRAVKALYRRQGDEALAILTDLVVNDPHWAVRREAIDALGAYEGPRAEAALATALADNTLLVRMQAVSSLQRIGSESAAWAISAAVLRHPDARVRAFAARSLADFEGEQAWRALDAALSDSDATVREAAETTLEHWYRLQAAP